MTTHDTVPARHGRAFRLKAGQTLKLINTTGRQVVDTWAFCDPDISEVLSMEHSREYIHNVYFHAGDTMVSSRNRPMLGFVEDTSDGGHDTLVAACSPGLYEQYGIPCPPHRACALNLAEAMAALGHEISEQPSPWNLFQHSFVNPDGFIRHEEPSNEAGCSVTLKAERDLILAFSCCPWDVEGLLINGTDGQINDCAVEIN